MSNYLSIATATATLSQVLREAIRTEITGADVTIARPHAAPPGNAAEDPMVNLYLYQITSNTAWANTDLPSRSSSGELRQRPQAALDLHYLLTFYGNLSDLEPERLLGIVVRTLHAKPVLTRQQISDTINNTSFSYLKDSDLHDADELVKFTPIPFSLEELSKLWSVFLQTSYTLSVAYKGTVVLIESEIFPSTPLPVRERNLYVLPFRQPNIEGVKAQDEQGKPANVIDPTVTLIIHGMQLKGDVTKIRLGSTELTPDSSAVTDKKILLPLETFDSLGNPVSNLPSGTLRAGVMSIQVIHQLSLGTPPEPHSGTESNVAAFILRPVIGVSKQTTGDIVTITVTTNPEVEKKQRVVLILNEMTDTEPKIYNFISEALTDDYSSSLTFTFNVSEVKAADYLVRLQVDGAESVLDVDNGQFSGPKVTIP